MDGVINLNKPAGWTSHDVVAKARGLLKEKQIGHLGTLDPLATGVLPLAVGTATRLVEFASYSKEYVTTCLLGRTTDSCDVSGKTLVEKPTQALLESDIRREVLNLKDITEQVPPMVSAVKVGGQKLYELARKGEVVERQARPIRLEEIECLSISGSRVTFRVVCSAGTYVRVLCQSLGEVLGVGGCMETLERTQVGPFKIAQALGLEDVKKKMEEGSLSDMLLPSSLLVGHLPQVILEQKALEILCHGVVQSVKGLLSGPVRVLNDQGRLCAIGEVESPEELKPRKVFGVEGLF